MEPTTQNNTLRSLLIFGIIGAVLLAAVVLGVRWARSRSDQLASNAGQQTQQPAEGTKQEEAKPAEEPAQTQQPQVAQNPPAQQNQSAPANTPSAPVAATPSTSVVATQTPSHVPSTGTGDVFLPVIAVAAFVFAATRYIQSKRRLAHLSQQAAR